MLALTSGLRISRTLASDSLSRASVCALCTVVQLITVPLSLAALTLLSAGAVLAGHVVATAIVWPFTPSTGTREAGTAARAGAGVIVASGVGAALAAFAAIPTARALDSFQSETRHYHFAMIASWLNRHTLWRLPFELPGWFTSSNPGNAEMLGLWLVLPTHREQVAFLMVIPLALLVVLGSAMLVRELGGRAWLGALAALGLVATPMMFQTQAHSFSSDLGAVSGFVCGIAFLARARHDTARRWLVLAGVALGLGIGSKYTVFAPTIAAVAIAALAIRPLKRLAWILPGVAGLGGPWMLRNWIRAGNPLFPEEIRVAGVTIFRGGVGPQDGIHTPIAHHILNGNGAIVRTWARFALNLYGPALIFAAVGLLSVVLARRSERRREITAVGILCAVAGLLYLATPLTGGGPNGFPSMIAANLRYFMPALVLGALLAVTVLPVKLGAAAAGGVLVWDLVELFHASTRAELRYPAVWIVVAVIVAAIGATIAAYHDRRPVRGAPAAALGILLALGAAGGAIWQSNRNPRTTPLDAAMTRVWRPGDVIGDVAARDFRSLMGIGLDRMLMMFPAGGRAGETPFKSARELDDAIARSNVRIIVFIAPGAVGPGVAGVYSVPKGWTPPPWCPAGGDRRVSVLVRPNADGSCPAIAG